MNRRNLLTVAVSLPALAACGTQPKDTTATINRVIAAIGGDGVGAIGAIALVAASRPELLPPSTSEQLINSLTSAKGLLVSLRDNLPDAMKPSDTWALVDGVLNMAQITLSTMALPTILDEKIKRYLLDAQVGLLAARTLVAGVRG